MLTEALSKGDQESAVKVTSELSEGMVQTVCDSRIALERPAARHVARLQRLHPRHERRHELPAAGQALGIGDHRSFCEIGQGALLNDIGVQGVPRHIMEKPDKLTDRERRIMQEHPTRGFKELAAART